MSFRSGEAPIQSASPQDPRGPRASTTIDAVLLIAFGGPTRREEIRPFLANVARGRPIPTERLQEVASHYERMPGARSPLNDLTERQAAALRTELGRVGLALPVHVGMRNWHPYLHETLAAMAVERSRRALGVILSSLQTDASWERYQRDVAAARAQVPGAPEVIFVESWGNHPLFIEAVADRVRHALDGIPAGGRLEAPLVFTAHSVPVAMAEVSPYVTQLTEVARQVAARLDHPRWSFAYQSRSGDPRDPWLEPDIGDILANLARAGARDVVVAPVGFVCDHVEVLYDLDVEARAVAEAHGLRLHRAGTVNDHHLFIRMLAEIVRRHAVAT
jgi:protoporphyrin/coproporphyrin ferrochelatase